MAIGAPNAGTATTFTAAATSAVPFPVSVTKESLLHLSITLNTAGASCTTPAGWTLAGSQGGTGGTTSPTTFAFYKIADGTEGGTNLTVTHSNVANRAQITEWTGVDQGTPLDVAPVATDDSVTASTTVLNTITPVTPGCTLIYSGGTNAVSQTETTPASGFTNLSNSSGATAMHVVDYQQGVAAGSAIGGTITWSGTGKQVVLLVALRPAIPVPAPGGSRRPRGASVGRRRPAGTLAPAELPQAARGATTRRPWVSLRRRLVDRIETIGVPFITGDSNGFEGGTLGIWSAGGTAPTLSNSTTRAQAGTHSLKMVATAANDANINSSTITVSAGQFFRIHAYVYCETHSRNLQITVTWFDANGVLAANTSLGTQVAGTLGGWTCVTLDTPVASRAQVVGMRVQVVAKSAAISDVFYIDDIDARLISYSNPTWPPVGWAPLRQAGRRVVLPNSRRRVAPILAQDPPMPSHLGRQRRRYGFTRKGKGATWLAPQFNPPFVQPPTAPHRRAGLLARRGKIRDAVLPQFNPPFVQPPVRASRKFAFTRRPGVRGVVPAQVTASPTWVQTWAARRVRALTVRRPRLMSAPPVLAQINPPTVPAVVRDRRLAVALLRRRPNQAVLAGVHAHVPSAPGRRRLWWPPRRAEGATQPPPAQVSVAAPARVDQPQARRRFNTRRPLRSDRIETQGTQLLFGDDTSFEGGAGNWAAISGAAIATSGTQAAQGGQSLKITLPAAANGAVRSPGGAPVKPVQPGDTVRVSGWLFAETNARTASANVGWQTASGGTAAPSSAVALGSPGVGVWTPFVAQFVVPSIPGLSRLLLDIAFGAGTVNDVVYLDGIDVRVRSHVAPQFPPIWNALARARRLAAVPRPRRIEAPITQAATPPPVLVTPNVLARRSRTWLARRGRIVTPVRPQANPPIVPAPARRTGRPWARRGHGSAPAPLAGTEYPQALRVRRRAAPGRRRTTPGPVPASATQAPVLVHVWRRRRPVARLVQRRTVGFFQAIARIVGGGSMGSGSVNAARMDSGSQAGPGMDAGSEGGTSMNPGSQGGSRMDGGSQGGSNMGGG